MVDSPPATRAKEVMANGSSIPTQRTDDGDSTIRLWRVVPRGPGSEISPIRVPGPPFACGWAFLENFRKAVTGGHVPDTKEKTKMMKKCAAGLAVMACIVSGANAGDMGHSMGDFTLSGYVDGEFSAQQRLDPS